MARTRQVVVTAVEGPLNNGHYKVDGTVNSKSFWAVKVEGHWQTQSAEYLNGQERRLVGSAATKAVRKVRA